MKPSTGVHDDLYARALVLSDGVMQAMVVTLDYLGFDFAYNDVLVAAVAKATGIPAGHVLINCSHTHNAPLTAPWGPWDQCRDAPFRKMLPRKLAEIAKRALDALRPARLAYRREPTQIGFNRRLLVGGRVTMAPNPEGAVLPWVDVVCVDSLDGKRIAVLFSHAAHPVVIHESSTLISADFPGFAVTTLRKAMGKQGVFLFAQGCAGNINAFPLKGGIDAAKAVGRDLGQAVARAVRGEAKPIPAPKLSIVSTEFTAPLQAPPPASHCKEMLARTRNRQRKARWARLLALAQKGKRPTMRFPVRALGFGKALCILGLPHEPFAEYHLWVNEVSPFAHTMVLGCTNGLECYVGTEKDYLLGERGGYEVSPRGAAAMYESALPLDPKAEQVIRQGIRKALRALASGGR